MPELPEVETTKRGIEPHITNRTISNISVFDSRLRWPVPAELITHCTGQKITAVSRRAKYILLTLQTHCMLIHLGMSGSLRMADVSTLRQKHDHLEIILSDQGRLLFNDPRRFGSIIVCQREQIDQHKLLAELGPEPLEGGFHGTYLYQRSKSMRTAPAQGKSKSKTVPVKSFIMDQRIVVGVGNIYANEALFLSGIHPLRKAGRISRERYQNLAINIKNVLSAAIDMGGTTLRDFVGGDGKPGYFQQTLLVYGRGDKACLRCGHVLKEIRVNQRTTVYCQLCQK